MPKFDPKTVQKELEKGILWPLYWIYGSERMKTRELVKRIQATAGVPELSTEFLEGAEVDASEVVDSAQSMTLGGGLRLIIVRDAHAIKEQEDLAPLLGSCGLKDQVPWVVIFLSKDLDGRKKFSKVLTERAAVIECTQVEEHEREAWIGYLAKRRELVLTPPMMAQLRMMDPWSLDLIERELEKLEVADGNDDVLVGGIAGVESELFFDAFFSKNKKGALTYMTAFAQKPEESLPLLGLFAWNVRHLALALNDRERGVRTLKLSPFLAGRFSSWSRTWKLHEVVALQKRLCELDYSVKQTPKNPLGLWATLIEDAL